jgi:hypothetical protein
LIARLKYYPNALFRSREGAVDISRVRTARIEFVAAQIENARNMVAGVLQSGSARLDRALSQVGQEKILWSTPTSVIVVPSLSVITSPTEPTFSVGTLVAE